jgi:hypothetical protein
MDDDSKDSSKDAAGSSPSPVDGPTNGEPDTLPPTWCRKCGAEVKPVGKGRCPRCQTFLRLNFSARKHPINKLRREQILDTLVRDYQPDTTVLRAKCEQLAGILEQLEAVKPGSQEHKRLVELSEQLGSSLEEANRQRRLETATGKTLEIRRVIVRRQEDNEPLIIDTTGPTPLVAGLPSEVSATPAGRASASTPAPAPECEYCGPRCVGPEHPAYSVLHWNDPLEVQRRDKEATAAMIKQLGKPLPEWYR